MLAIVATVSVFHLGILLKIIPYEITWGGRLKDDAEMYVFETISILINFIFCFFIYFYFIVIFFVLSKLFSKRANFHICMIFSFIYIQQ